MNKQVRATLAVAFSFGLIAAACGSDDGSDAADTPETDAVEAPSNSDVSETDAVPADTDEEASSDPSGEATGEPITIGVQNLEGDPGGSFPEYSIGIQSAADYINAELGGLGGRPIEIELCKSVVSPDDSQRCANELSAAGVDLAISTVNFFGNQFSIYQGSDIPVIIGTPITVGDLTSEGAYAIGAGGGCPVVHTGLVEFATNELADLEDIEVERIEHSVVGQPDRRDLLQRQSLQTARCDQRHRARHVRSSR